MWVTVIFANFADMTERIFRSPVGELLLAANNGELLLCDWVKGQHFERSLDRVRKIADTFNIKQDNLLIDTAIVQLTEYFAGGRTDFSLPLSPIGTEFQKLVWEALKQIPYGSTVSYGELARCIGRPLTVRAVANAVGCNPLSIIVPCHRVIGSNGALTGYAGKLLDAKQYLLRLEGYKIL